MPSLGWNREKRIVIGDETKVPKKKKSEAGSNKKENHRIFGYKQKRKQRLREVK